MTAKTMQIEIRSYNSTIIELSLPAKQDLLISEDAGRILEGMFNVFQEDLKTEKVRLGLIIREDINVFILETHPLQSPLEIEQLGKKWSVQLAIFIAGYEFAETARMKKLLQAAACEVNTAEGERP